jgi:hypothetical protein
MKINKFNYEETLKMNEDEPTNNEDNNTRFAMPSIQVE